MTYPELNSYFLVQEDAPEYYTLRFDQTTPAIIIGFHEILYDFFVSEHQKWSLLKDLEKELKSHGYKDVSFADGSSQRMGFGGTLSTALQGQLFDDTKSEKAFKEFVIPIPVLEKEAGKCDSCGGSGEDPDFSNGCLRCDGSGKKVEIEWGELDLICATLCLFSQTMLYYPAKSLLAPLQGLTGHSRQLLVFQTNFSRDGRTFIGATLSPKLTAWLRTKKARDLEAVRQATCRTYFQLFPGYRRFGDHSFHLRLYDNGRLSFDVPGSATGLLVDGFDHIYEGGGLTLTDHNVDTHAQQISLLAGLAALYGLARKELA